LIKYLTSFCFIPFIQDQQGNQTRSLQHDERVCKSYLGMARETVEMFHFLTQVQNIFEMINVEMFL